MPNHDIVVIGTSAGGVEALKKLVPTLKPRLLAAIFIVIHISPQSRNLLPGILDMLGPLPAVAARNGLAIEPGYIYVAQPDHHLLLEQDHMLVVRGPKENRHRPAIDPLFRSAAVAYGSRVIGVVLTGNLDDGTAGLKSIKDCGGIAIVQDPQEAAYGSMPNSAMKHVEVDYCLPLLEIGARLAQLIDTPTPAAAARSSVDLNNLKVEVDSAKMAANRIEDIKKIGLPSAIPGQPLTMD